MPLYSFLRNWLFEYFRNWPLKYYSLFLRLDWIKDSNGFQPRRWWTCWLFAGRWKLIFKLSYCSPCQTEDVATSSPLRDLAIYGINCSPLLINASSLMEIALSSLMWLMSYKTRLLRTFVEMLVVGLMILSILTALKNIKWDR